MLRVTALRERGWASLGEGPTLYVITSVGERRDSRTSLVPSRSAGSHPFCTRANVSIFELPIQPAMVILFISGVWSRESTVGYLPGRAIVYGLILLNRDHED